MSTDNSQSLPVKRKRAKISYSCIVCREKRTKCDKNSICTACKNRGTTCQYDTVTQIKPKRPNKDALILRLSKQLEFYKDLACKYTPKDKLSLFNDDIHAIDYALGTRTLKKVNIKQDLNIASPIIVNDDDHYILKLKRNDDNFLYDIFTDMYIFKTDDYVNTLFFKKNNTSATINSKKDDISIINNLLSNQTFKSEFQKSQSLKFTQTLHMENSTKENKEFFNPYSGLFNTFRFENVVENTIENVIDTEPSDLLKNIIILLNQILPSKFIIHHYKKVYFEQLYLEYPYLDIDFFEKTLLEVLYYDNEKVTINLGKTDIHNKICMIALLLLILYLAIFNENDNLDFDNSIIEEYLGIAMKLLLSTDYLSNPNEHKFSLLCQVWVCLTISPESKYSEDITKKAPTGFLVGVITSLAHDLKIGYDTDLDERADKLPNDLRILRKKLSSAYTFITLCEDTLKDGVKDIKKFQNLPYECVVEGLNSDNELDNEAYRCCMLRNHQYKLVYDIMAMFLKGHADGDNEDFTEKVDIVLLNTKIKLLMDFVDKSFPFDGMQKLANTKEVYQYPRSLKIYSVNKNLLMNLFTMHHWITARAIILRVYHVVLVSCEYWAFESFNKVANKWFMYYINASLHQSMDLLVMVRKIHDHEYSDYLNNMNSLFQEFIILYTYSKAFIVLLQYIGKCFVFKVYLQMMVMNEKDDSTKLKVEMHLIEEMNDVSSKVIFKALQEYSYLYRFKRYKSFKVCLFFDFFKQITTDGTLFNTMFETNEKYEPGAPLDTDVCNSTLMRHYLKFYDYLDNFKSMTDYFRSDEIQNYLKKKPLKNRSKNHGVGYSHNNMAVYGKNPIDKHRFNEYPGHLHQQQNISPGNPPLYQNVMNNINYNMGNVPNFTKFKYVPNFDMNNYQPYPNGNILPQNNRGSISKMQLNNMAHSQGNVMDKPQMNYMQPVHNLQMMANPLINTQHSSRSSNPNTLISGIENVPQGNGYPANISSSNSNHTNGDNQTSISITDNEGSNDDFTFEDYLRQLDLQKFDVFGSAFLF